MGPMGLFVRTIGIARARMKIGLAISPTTCTASSGCERNIPPPEPAHIGRHSRRCNPENRYMRARQRRNPRSPTSRNPVRQNPQFGFRVFDGPARVPDPSARVWLACPSRPRESALAFFSSIVLRCLGAATIVASTICPLIAKKPADRNTSSNLWNTPSTVHVT